jgi:phosphatidylglycerophosphatase C
VDFAIFDFDGTITTKGTYPGFVRFAVRPWRKLAGGIILSPLLIGYKCGLVSDRCIRSALSRVEPWCRTLGADVICTQLETKSGRLTGRYVHGDCCGEEKARRIREHYVLAEYETIHAYGDTEEDRQMLDMADRKYFRWQEVAEVPAVSRATLRGDGGV